MSPAKTGAGVVAARLILGVVFVWLGVVKTLDPAGFLKLVHQFDVLTGPPWLNVVAAVLPWFEIFCGTLLLLGVKPRAAAFVELLLLGGFTALVLVRAIGVYRAGGVAFCAIKFDCGCGTGEVLVCMKLLENTALMVLAAMVVFVPNPMLCLRPDRSS